MSAVAADMASRIHHRGPNDHGVWVDAQSGIALAHRRLSIVDLSPSGHQPMHSSRGRWVLVFNGEIYNHLDLRKRLEAESATPAWHGRTDTETLLACVEAWGIDRMLEACVGMFAFALWDRQYRSLTLARDRMGEKPLYYGWQGSTFLFGSELKALVAHPAFERSIDRNAVASLLRHNYIPAPSSIWRGIRKLQPGCLLTVSSNSFAPSPRQYWSLAEVAERGQRHPLDISLDAASRELESMLLTTVAGQMTADVPLGALLSGGVDSASVVALMQAQSSRAVRTFTVGFHEKAYDESNHASSIARHLGTDHTELLVTAKDMLNVVPRMPVLYDEPFADSSQLPTMLVMTLARQRVTVALSGDGGDEVFCGYNRYLLAPRVWNLIRYLPVSVRTLIGRLLVGISPMCWDRLAAPLAYVIGQSHVGNKLHRLGHRLVHVRSIEDLYAALVSEWPDAELAVQGATISCRSPSFGSEASTTSLSHPVSRMMLMDALTYLPDDILVKVDRAAMGVSLETRAPFLDHRVVEFAWQLPLSLKLVDGRGKAVLRQILYRYVPRQLLERPKMGFGIPLDTWLRGELREWAEDLLSPDALQRSEIFDTKVVRTVWEAHCSEAGSYGSRIWPVLMFQAWFNEWK